MNSTQPSQLELRAIARALAGPEIWKRQLLEQLDTLAVLSREDTGAGFYTYFAAPRGAASVEIPREAYSEPPQCFASHSAIPGGAFFLVWLKAGRIDCLEGATGTSPLPGEEGFVFT